MTRQILLLATIAVVSFSSCTTAYKTGQTPDDVYYSPARPQESYVTNDDDRRDEYRYDDEYYDDRYLRMKVRNRYQWEDLNDWYFYDRYSYTYNYHYGSWYNPYNSWNYYHNPYCCNCNTIIYNPKSPQTHTVITRPRTFNVNSYTNGTYNNTNAQSNIKLSKPGYTSRPIFNNTNNVSNNNSGRKNDGAGSVIRRILSPSSNNNNNESSNSNSNSNSSSRTYTPSSNSSSNSSGNSNNSSGNSGGGVSRPNRGGK